jgi:putative phosphoribosyl transferase
VLFRDRADAGRALAGAMPFDEDVTVLALPRGGVPIGSEVAQRLGAPLDVVGVRKLGAPGHPEYGIGAIAEGGVRVLDQRAVSALGLDDDAIAAVEERERRELDRRLELYREGRDLPELTGRTAIVVDDGLATGVTAHAAVEAARTGSPERVVLAVPVGSSAAVVRLAEVADEVICLHTPDRFQAVGVWYERFDQTSDDEVLHLLAEVGTTTSRGRR